MANLADLAKPRRKVGPRWNGPLLAISANLASLRRVRAPYRKMRAVATLRTLRNLAVRCDLDRIGLLLAISADLASLRPVRAPHRKMRAAATLRTLRNLAARLDLDRISLCWPFWPTLRPCAGCETPIEIRSFFSLTVTLNRKPHTAKPAHKSSSVLLCGRLFPF